MRRLVHSEREIFFLTDIKVRYNIIKPSEFLPKLGMDRISVLPYIWIFVLTDIRYPAEAEYPAKISICEVVFALETIFSNDFLAHQLPIQSWLKVLTN